MPASGASRKTPEPNMQRKEKLREVLCWQAETTVSYVPEGKRAGTASFVRYERYSKATTVGEALQLGSSAEDLINDYMKGILKVTGGPKREKPLELEEVTRGEGLTETDKQLGKFLKNFHRVELASQLASETGVDPKALTSKRSWCESPVMHAKRTFAQRAAEEVLKQVEESGGKVTDEHVLDLLRKWAFRRNATRRNVAPADRPVVDSDTFGVMRNQAGVWIVTHATRDYPAVTKLLMRWLLDTLPLQDVCITSIHVNSGFAARRHRDRDNLGPTFMRALGDFSEGGQLWYWPDDDGVAAVERLPEELRVTLDMRAAPAIIDGKRAHEVEPFKGERFGIVFYTANNSQKIPKAIADELATYGLRMPDKEGIEAARHFFTAPKGYGLEPAESTGPSKRSAGEDGGSRPGHKRSRKGAAAKQSLLAKLRQNATQKEEEGGNAGGAKDAKKGSLKQAVLKTTLKQAVLKLKGKEDPKGKLGALKVMKTKAGAAGGLLARMMAKRAPRVEGGSGPKEGGEDAAAKASAEPAEKEKKSADGSGAKGTNGALKPTKVVAGGLLARVIAAKEAKAPPAASAAPSSDPEAPAEEAGQDTPQRKRSNSAGASRSGSSGPPSTKKQKPPGKEGSAGKEAAKAKSSSKAGKSGSEEAKASTEETKAPSAGPTEGAAPEKSPEPAAPAPAPPAAAPAPAAAAPVPAPTPSAAVAPAPPAAAAPAVPAAAAPAVPAAAPAMAAPAPRVVPETVRAAAAALGLSAASGSGSAGREAVSCQHFLLLANVMRTVEENPSATISTLADYFQVLLRMAETPELLLRTALDLLLPAGAAPQEAIEAAIAGAFGAAAGQTAKEKGLPEAAQEGRRAKRSLRAPPPRLTLPEVAEALAAARAGDGASLARALGATRPEGREAFFLVKALQGAAGASMGDVHAAVAKAMVCAAGAA